MKHSIQDVHQGCRHRVKDEEKALIMSRISTESEATRKRLVESLNLRPTTISNVVQELLDQNLVSEGRVLNPGSQGRPERELLPNFSRLAAISIRVASRAIIAELVNFGDEIVAERQATLPVEADDQQAVQVFSDLIKAIESETPPGSDLVGVGMSLPGIVSPRDGRWLYSSRWHNIQAFQAQDVERAVDLPVQIHGMQEAELRYLMEREKRLKQGGTLLLHWGYGIGAAYAYEGQVQTSSVGSFAEIGHVRLFPSSRKRCMCGDFGCLETEAALWALMPEIRDQYPEAPEQEEAFADFYQTLDPLELPGVSSAINSVGLAMGGLYRILFPDRVLVFGPFTQHDLIAQTLRRRFLSELPHYAPDTVSFEVLARAFEGGEAFGTTHALFSHKLSEMLLARK